MAEGANTFNATESTLVKNCTYQLDGTTKGSGKVYGVLVNSHSSGTMQFLDGLTQTGSTKATGTLTLSGGGLVPAVYASNTLTSDATNNAEDKIVTIGTTVYRWRNTLLAAYDVKIGVSAAVSLDNLKAAINASGTPGTEYFAGTLEHPDVVATANGATTQVIIAKEIGTASNSIVTTEDGDHLSWAETTLGGGGATTIGVATAGATFTIDDVVYYFTTVLAEDHTTAIPYQILWVTNDATALDNMKSAINASGTEGTDYSTDTAIHPSVTATTNGATTQVVQAIVDETPGNAITTTEGMAEGAWGAATLEGGTDESIPKGGTYTFISGSNVITFPEPMNFSTGIYYFVNGTTQNVTIFYN